MRNPEQIIYLVYRESILNVKLEEKNAVATEVQCRALAEYELRRRMYIRYRKHDGARI